MECLIHILKPYFLNEIMNIMDDVTGEHEGESTVKTTTRSKHNKEGLEIVSKHIREDWKNTREIRNKACDRLEVMTKHKCKTLNKILRNTLDELSNGFVSTFDTPVIHIDEFALEVFHNLSFFLADDVSKKEWFHTIIPECIESVVYKNVPWDRIYEKGKQSEKYLSSSSREKYMPAEKKKSEKGAEGVKEIKTGGGKESFVFSVKGSESASKWANTTKPDFALKKLSNRTNHSSSHTDVSKISGATSRSGGTGTGTTQSSAPSSTMVLNA